MLYTQTLEKLRALRLEGMAQSLEEQRHQTDITQLDFEARLALTIALLFVGAMLLLTGAFVAFFIEVRLAISALRIGRPRARTGR